MPEGKPGKAAGRQKEWDRLLVQEEYSQLLASYTEPRHRARLLAASSGHSGDWLHVLPIAACGLHLGDEAVRVAVGLRFGCALCEAHACRCGASIGTLVTLAIGTHAFLAREAPAEYSVTTHT